LLVVESGILGGMLYFSSPNFQETRPRGAKVLLTEKSMNRSRQIMAWLAVLMVAMAAEPRAQPVRISLELFTDDGFGVDDSHRWYELLTGLGVANLQIRGAAPGDEIGVHEGGKRDAKSYAVTGRITASNVLQLPGGKFTLQDSARLKNWLKNLSEQGPDGVVSQKGRFGLTPVQLQAVQSDLRRPIGFATKDLSSGELVARIAGGLDHKIEMSAAAHEALAKRKVADDLQGISTGTAVAVILRPAGLVLVPERPEGKTVQYRVEAPLPGREAWPPGSQSEKPDRDLLPELFKFIHIEIDETPLVEAIEPLQKRLAIPFLWDHLALESQAGDLTQTQVKLPTKRLSYGMILQKVLSQAKLQKELRVDDNGKPFLWITTFKPVTPGVGS
jgi:hypothetical protein